MTAKHDYSAAMEDMSRLSWQDPSGDWNHVERDDFISFLEAHYQTIRASLRQSVELERKLSGLRLSMGETCGPVGYEVRKTIVSNYNRALDDIQNILAASQQGVKNLAVSVNAAHKALTTIENIATRAGLDCRNKQNMWFEGARGKEITVLLNGERT